MEISSRPVAWSVLACVVALNAAGYVFDLWSDVSWYDNALHAVTSFGVTLVVGVYLAPLLAFRRHEVLLFTVLVASLGIALGVLWEIGEWIFDQQFTSGSAIPGKKDTIIDLALDGAGCLVGAFLAIVLRRRAHTAD